MVKWLMKGATVLVGKRKTAMPVAPSPLVELAKPHVKVSVRFMKVLIPELCPERELLAKQFCSN